ncbi:hypothetical protein [Sphingomicrobium astaxanthinifaciens]|uniref:hypothetical protein n=1 Tax=Sphingomicrobium astaxanthinifaciens TaxID=1227949 RepID=UPI001FCBA9CE|nr:hypothetical protein [Sphingomicrobium astaxanthinifaciens]MCJ7422060.1 hypothetical protein [Sphingomicrobium astaxanthinifaciens]
MDATPPTASPGERREARRVRLQKIVIALALLLGMGMGIGFGLLSVGGEDAFAEGREWPTGFAIAVAAGVLVVMPLLMLTATRTADELEMAHQAFGMQVGGFVLLCGYPAWYALWKGGLVPEPGHEVLWLGFFAPLVAGYVFHRFR